MECKIDNLFSKLFFYYSNFIDASAGSIIILKEVEFKSFKIETLINLSGSILTIEESKL